MDDERYRGNRIELVIPVQPIPKGRPRFGKGHAYTPEKKRDYEQIVSLIARTAIKRPLTGAVRLEISLYLQTPKSWSNRKIKAAEIGDVRPTTKPDIDNLVKAVLDALNDGIGYVDDKQIVEMHCYEYYSETPRTEIRLEEI